MVKGLEVGLSRKQVIQRHLIPVVGFTSSGRSCPNSLLVSRGFFPDLNHHGSLMVKPG
jgi:hypothetical protein